MHELEAKALKQIKERKPESVYKSTLGRYFQQVNDITEDRDCPECNELNGSEIDCNTCYGKGTVEVIKPLTEDELNEKTEAYLKEQYAVLREREYPPMAEYLDAIVKDDTEAIEAYKQKCLDVKARFPKT